MISQRQWRQLSNARSKGEYQFVKKPKTDTEKNNPTNLDNNNPNPDYDKPDGPSWYWNNNSDNNISDSDEGRNNISGYNSESD